MSMFRDMRRICLLVLLVAGAYSPLPVMAQSQYPSKPITLMLGFPPGGSVDITGRILAEALKNRLGQPVVVENRPGATGVLAARQVATSAADGYTLLWAPEFDTTNIVLLDGKKQLQFTTDDLVMIGGGAFTPYYLVVNGKSRWKTIEELLEYGKKNPGKLTYSSSGPGSINYVGVELFLRRVGVSALHIPFKGGAEAVNALLGSQVDMHMSSGGRIKSMVEAGSLRPLVMFADERATAAPFNVVPTTKEKNYVIPDLSLFHILAVPKGVPLPVIERLKQVLKDGMNDPTFVATLERMLYSPKYISSEQIGTMQRGYSDKMRDVLRALEKESAK